MVLAHLEERQCPAGISELQMANLWLLRARYGTEALACMSQYLPPAVQAAHCNTVHVEARERLWNVRLCATLHGRSGNKG